MFLIPSFICFLFPLTIHSLVCPIYNLFNNETSTISSCDKSSSLCTYIITRSNYRRCLGIYTFDVNTRTKENSIRIRQLALVDDFEEKYLNDTECILDIDKTGNNLLCRCNSNNCTLKWKKAENFNKQFHQIQQLIKQHKHRNRSSSLMIILIITIMSFISLFLIIMSIKCNWYIKKRQETDVRSFLANISFASTHVSNADIDEFLSSNPTYQSIISHGKNSIIYRAWTTGKEHEKRLVAVKVYHSKHYKNIFENEVQILRICHHSTIVK